MSFETALNALVDVDDLQDISVDPFCRFAMCSIRKATAPAEGHQTSIWRMEAPPLAGMSRVGLPGRSQRDPRVSPSGDQLAFVAIMSDGAGGTVNCLFVAAIDGTNPAELARCTTAISNLSWSPSSESLLFVTWSDVHLTTEQTAPAHELACPNNVNSDAIVTEEPFYRSWDRFLPRDGAPQLFRVSVDGSSCTNLLEGASLELPRWGANDGLFTVSPSTGCIYFLYDKGRTQHYGSPLGIAICDGPDHPARPLLWAHGESFSHPSVSPDGLKLAFISSTHQDGHADRTIVSWISLESGAEERRIDIEHDVHWEGPVRWTADSLSLLVCGQLRGRQHLWRIDCALKAPQVLISGGWITGFDVAGDSQGCDLVYLMSSAMHPTRAFAKTATDVTRIDSFNRDLKQFLPQTDTQEVWINAAQGDTMQLWVTSSSGQDRTRRPVFLHLHGGPHVAVGDSWNYRWNRDLLVALGYAVVSPNFHGSPGFGYGFLDSTSGRWGAIELREIKETLSWIGRQAWADTSRIYAGGGSYGGTLATWLNGISCEPSIRALVCHGGVFDWSAMMAQDVYVQQLKALGAWPWESADLLQRQSPASAARQFNIPTLIIHAQNDFRVPDAQGFAHYNTLCAIGVPAKLVWFKRDNHRIVKRKNNLTWWREVAAWLKRYE